METGAVCPRWRPLKKVIIPFCSFGVCWNPHGYTSSDVLYRREWARGGTEHSAPLSVHLLEKTWEFRQDLGGLYTYTRGIKGPNHKRVHSLPWRVTTSNKNCIVH